MSKRSKQEAKYFENLYKIEKVENADDKIQKQMDALVQAIQNEYSYKDSHSDFSVYTGTAGISYMYFYLYEHSTNPTTKDHYLEQAFNYLAPSLELAKHEKKRSKRDVTFIMGEPGPYALAAVLYHIKNDAKLSTFYQSELKDFVNIVFDSKFKSNELLYGRVGFLYTLLFVSKHLGKSCEPWIEEQIPKLAHLVIKLGREYELDCPLMYEWHHKTYLAGAHGVAGILKVLLQVPNLLQDEAIKRDIKGTVDYILGLQFPSHNFPTRVDGTSDDLVQWCHGAPAISMLLVDIYHIFKDEKYLVAAKNSAEEVWKRGLLRKGLSICHGVSGNGFVFLKLWEETKEHKYEDMALKFCEWMWSEEGSKTMQTPDNPFSLFEGIAGAVCYLEACLKRNEPIKFPSYDL